MADISDLIGPGAIPPQNPSSGKKPEERGKADQAQIEITGKGNPSEPTAPAMPELQPLDLGGQSEVQQQAKAAGAKVAIAAIANQAVGSGIAQTMQLNEVAAAQQQQQSATQVAATEAEAAVEQATQEEQANQQQQQQQQYQQQMLEAAKKRQEQIQKNQRLQAKKKKKKKGGFVKKAIKKSAKNAATRDILYAGGGPIVGGSFQIIDWLT